MRNNRIKTKLFMRWIIVRAQIELKFQYMPKSILFHMMLLMMRSLASNDLMLVLTFHKNANTNEA